MVKAFEILAYLSAAIALSTSLYRLIDAYHLRDKARRVLSEVGIVNARIRLSLQSDNTLQVEKAMEQLRKAVREDRRLDGQFTRREKKTLRKVLSDRAGARFLAY